MSLLSQGLQARRKRLSGTSQASVRAAASGPPRRCLPGSGPVLTEPGAALAVASSHRPRRA